MAAAPLPDDEEILAEGTTSDRPPTHSSQPNSGIIATEAKATASIIATGNYADHTGTGAKTIEKGKGDTPLHVAASRGDLDRLRELLDQGGDLSLVNDKGYQPLHCAAKNDRKEAVILLLEKGAKHDVRSKKKETPLMLACRSGCRDTAAELVKRHPNDCTDLLLADVAGNTVLHLAVICGPFLIKDLLELIKSSSCTKERLDALVAAKNSVGHTLLHTAILNGCNKEVFGILQQCELDGAIGNEFTDTDKKMHDDYVKVQEQFASAKSQSKSKPKGPPAILLHPQRSLSQDSTVVTPGSEGVNYTGDIVRLPITRSVISQKRHEVSVRTFALDDIPEGEDKSLAIDRRTDTAVKLELLCGPSGLMLQRLNPDHHLIAPLVMIKSERINPFKVEVTIPIAYSDVTCKGKKASTQIQVFAWRGISLHPLKPDDWELKNAVIIRHNISIQCVLIVTVIGSLQKFEESTSFLHRHSKPDAEVVPHPVAIKCCYAIVVQNSLGDSPAVITVYCAIDWPDHRKLIAEKCSGKEHNLNSMILSHEMVELTCKLLKGHHHHWKLQSNETLKIATSGILPAHTLTTASYPAEYHFELKPTGPGKSKDVKCQVQMTCGHSSAAPLINEVVLCSSNPAPQAGSASKNASTVRNPVNQGSNGANGAAQKAPRPHSMTQL